MLQTPHIFHWLYWDSVMIPDLLYALGTISKTLHAYITLQGLPVVTVVASVCATFHSRIHHLFSHLSLCNSIPKVLLGLEFILFSVALLGHVVLILLPYGKLWCYDFF